MSRHHSFCRLFRARGDRLLKHRRPPRDLNLPKGQADRLGHGVQRMVSNLRVSTKYCAFLFFISVLSAEKNSAQTVSNREETSPTNSNRGLLTRTHGGVQGSAGRPYANQMRLSSFIVSLPGLSTMRKQSEPQELGLNNGCPNESMITALTQ